MDGLQVQWLLDDTVEMVDQQLRSLTAHLVARHVHGGERRLDELGEREVVEPGHGEILGDAQAARAQGFADYWLKPIDIPRLLADLRALRR